MKRLHIFTALATSIALTACGGGNSIIDKAKAASLAECPGEEFGDIVNGFFITGLDTKTTWTAYRTDDPEVVRVTAEGGVMFGAAITTATLEVLYNESRDELTLSTAKAGGKEGPVIAQGIVAKMCDTAKGIE